MDHFKEEVAIRRNRTLFDLLYILSFVMLIACSLMALFLLQVIISMLTNGAFEVMPLILFLLMGGMAFFIWRYKDELKAEYEYTFTNGILDVAKVLNNKKRRYLTALDMKEVAAAGAVAGNSFSRYVSMPGIKVHNWFLNRDAHLYYYFFTKNGVKHLMVVELSDEMAALTHQGNYMNQGVWQ